MLSADTLYSGLLNLAPAPTEADGISAFAAAYRAYFAQATVDGVSVTTSALLAPENAFRAALAGIGSGGAAPKFAAAIVAWWGAVNLGAGGIWTGHVPPVLGVTPPAGLATLSTTLGVVFAANIAAKGRTREACVELIANAIHGAHTGGVAAVGPPAGSFTIV